MVWKVHVLIFLTKNLCNLQKYGFVQVALQFDIYCVLCSKQHQHLSARPPTQGQLQLLKQLTHHSHSRPWTWRQQQSRPQVHLRDKDNCRIKSFYKTVTIGLLNLVSVKSPCTSRPQTCPSFSAVSCSFYVMNSWIWYIVQDTAENFLGSRLRSRFLIFNFFLQMMLFDLTEKQLTTSESKVEETKIRSDETILQSQLQLGVQVSCQGDYKYTGNIAISQLKISYFSLGNKRGNILLFFYTILGFQSEVSNSALPQQVMFFHN